MLHVPPHRALDMLAEVGQQQAGTTMLGSQGTHTSIDVQGILRTLLRSENEAMLDGLRSRRRSTGVRAAAAQNAIAGETHGYASEDIVIEAPPSRGLHHIYIVAGDEHERITLHRMMAGRANVVVRTYRHPAHFLGDAHEEDEGCVILHEDGRSELPLPDLVRDMGRDRRFACVVLMTTGDMRSAIEVMKAGAIDCLGYPCPAEAIIASVDEALAVARRAASEQAQVQEARRAIGRLTSRERDVLHGLIRGQSNKMIALDLQISPRTVEIYRAHLMEKLGTTSLSETLKVAFAAGLR